VKKTKQKEHLCSPQFIGRQVFDQNEEQAFIKLIKQQALIGIFLYLYNEITTNGKTLGN
jgi:hypothetical protein